MKTAEHQILTRIGFAERWLQRAREECLDGDVVRGLFTLVLADAEVRRVLQLAVPPAPRPRLRPAPLAAVAAGLVIAAFVALQLGVPDLRAEPVEPVGLAPGLLLRPGTGALFEPIEAAQQEVAAPQEAPRTISIPRFRASVSAAPAKRSPVRRSTGTSFPVALQHAAIPVKPIPQPAAVPVPAVRPPAPAPAPDPAISPGPASAASVSAVDLLDLVIIADRTLRRSQP